MALFCDVDLARRIDAAECDLIAGGARRVARRLPGVYSESIGGGRAVCTEPGSPLNKVAGLGFSGPLDEAAWVTVENAFAARDVPVQVEVSTLADPCIGEWLSRRGYAWVGAENVLGCVLEAHRPPAGTIQVVPGDDMETWLDAVVKGFLAPDDSGVPSHESLDAEVVRRVMRDFNEGEGRFRYLAVRDGDVAGGGSMRIDGDIAQLCGASTLPDHRRLGVQTALLVHRLADAACRGAKLAVVTTQPGSMSQRNVQKQGFQLLYSRNVFLSD